MRIRRSLESALAVALLIAAAGCRAGDAAPAAAASERPDLGFMGTIPIYWGEQAALGDALSGNAAPHWARAQLETGYVLRPLDVLSEQTLAGLDYLLLAQPRALSGPENVALDAWVRRGGRVLLFADPMLTGESRFALGDRRRPQDVILLSPVLTHWGLRLEFDDAQPAGPTVVDGAARIPVDLPGRLTAIEGEAECTIEAAGVLARCAIGEGGALVLADAALLNLYEPDPSAPAALDWLLEEGFGDGKTREAPTAR